MSVNKIFFIWKCRQAFLLFTLISLLLHSLTFAMANMDPEPSLDLSTATIVICQNADNSYEATAAQVLAEEVQKRTGLKMGNSHQVAENRPGHCFSHRRNKYEMGL